jgi:hypothetical protein
MPKIVIQTGSGSHSTSSASCVAKFVGGPNDGKHLYQVPQFQVGKGEWDTSKQNEKWVTTAYELVDGTKIEIIGKGRTGARGADKHAFHRVYVVNSSAPVLEEYVDVGLKDCLLKGRLELVRDVLASYEKAQKSNLTEGF